MACASPRRSDICARARSSYIKFIFLLRFVRAFMGGWFRFWWLGPSRSQRAGEHETGLEGCTLGTAGLPPCDGETGTAAQALGLLQTRQLLRPGQELLGVHG